MGDIIIYALTINLLTIKEYTVREIPITREHKVMDRIMRFMRAHHRCIERELEAFDAHHSSGKLLLLLDTDATPKSQREIAKMCGVTPACIARMLKPMEVSGLVSRSNDESDSRRNTVNITEKGHALVDSMHHVFESVDHRVFAGITDDELEAFSLVLEKMSLNLQANDQGSETL